MKAKPFPACHVCYLIGAGCSALALLVRPRTVGHSFQTGSAGAMVSLLVLSALTIAVGIILQVRTKDRPNAAGLKTLGTGPSAYDHRLPRTGDR
jgi:sugar phosphate permease